MKNQFDFYSEQSASQPIRHRNRFFSIFSCCFNNLFRIYLRTVHVFVRVVYGELISLELESSCLCVCVCVFSTSMFTLCPKNHFWNFWFPHISFFFNFSVKHYDCCNYVLHWMIWIELNAYSKFTHFFHRTEFAHNFCFFFVSLDNVFINLLYKCNISFASSISWFENKWTCNEQ